MLSKPFQLSHTLTDPQTYYLGTMSDRIGHIEAAPIEYAMPSQIMIGIGFN